MQYGKGVFGDNWRYCLCSGCTLLLIAAPALHAQDRNYQCNLYGTSGLIDMPSARSAEDAELAATLSHFVGSTRTILSFQITPRLADSFRY